MKFEFDPNKSRSNAEKHGIDFETAQALWKDERLIVVFSREADEPRFLAIGKIKDKHWSAVFTERGENIRLISVRRSRKQEILFYEEN
jgi:uncharacterized DUF497 family protein